MSKFWLIAGNGAQARVFEGVKPNMPLEEIECLVNPAAHQKELELVSDRPGRHADDGHGYSAEETHKKERELDAFARDIADFINKAHGAGRFEKLSVVAAPALLGRLRKNYSSTVERAILEEIDKDLTSAGVAEIQEHLERLA